MKQKYLFSAALLAISMTAAAQTTQIGFETEDYKTLGVYDQWSESPFRKGTLQGNVAVVDNPDTAVDQVLGTAPNPSAKVVALQRSRHAGNAFGLRIDLKEPLRVTKHLQYIHIMALLKDKPADSRLMVIGLGKRLEKSWEWQTGEDEQFWATTVAAVKAKEGWQDIVVSFKGFSYSKEEKVDSGIDIHSLVIVPDLRSPHADATDWVAYFDSIVVDNNPDKRFSTDKYAINMEPEQTPTRSDRRLNGVGLLVDGVEQSVTGADKLIYTDMVSTSVFSVKTGLQVQPKFSYEGTWMSGYVYVDWGNDGVFSFDVNDDGTPALGSDIVSYNAAQVNGTWRKSDGSTVSDGDQIGAGVPKFTVPADAQTGFYRMRYKVDWDHLNPAGASSLVSNGGGIVDLVLDVHGETVSVNASQLNGDIVLADGLVPLQNYQAAYNQPLKVKVIPAPGFVQNGFQLKYGYNVNTAEQLDENGNPNWILVNVPMTDIAADSTYTIPAQYIRGGNVSIVGDMQQVYQYTVNIVGAPEGQGGVIFLGKEYAHQSTIIASQYFTSDDVQVVNIDGYISSVVLEGNTLTVTYKAIQAYRNITSLSELRNDMAYHIKAKSGEGYLAWNSTITNKYVSLRGVTNYSYNQMTSNQAVAEIYQQEVSPFDSTVIWQLLNDGNSLYLYQPANQCYVTRTGRDYIFTTQKKALDNIRDNGDGTFSIHAGGGYSDGSTYFACIVTNEASCAVRNWTWNDHGSVMYIVENPNVEVNDIITSIQDIILPNEQSIQQGIYNVQGQRLLALPKEGVVIVDGKKKVIRK